VCKAGMMGRGGWDPGDQDGAVPAFSSMLESCFAILFLCTFACSDLSHIFRGSYKDVIIGYWSKKM
jgi:hypothetical protein